MDVAFTGSDVIDNDTQWTPDNPEREEQEQKENSKVTTSLPVVQEVLDWFAVNIELYAGIDALNINGSTAPEDAKVSILLAKGMNQAFKDKSEEFKLKFARYLQEETE